MFAKAMMGKTDVILAQTKAGAPNCIRGPFILHQHALSFVLLQCQFHLKISLMNQLKIAILLNLNPSF